MPDLPENALTLVPHKWRQDGRYFIAVSIPEIDYLSPPLRLQAVIEAEADMEAELNLIELVSKMMDKIGIDEDHVHWGEDPRDRPEEKNHG